LLSGPSGTACRTTTCTADFSYDPRDRLVGQTTVRSGVSKTATYTLDSAGNITQLSRNGDVTTYTYSGDQLQTRTHASVTRDYFYDRDGNLNCITTSAGSQADCNPPAGAPIPASLLVDHAYDYLDRLSSIRTYSGGSISSSADYGYDALSRLSQESELHSGSTRATSVGYVGASSALDKETATGAANWTKTYSYDANGRPFDLTRTPSGGSATRYDYGYDARGDVSMLIGSGGTAAAAYGYDAYGVNDSELSAGDTSTTDPTNAYRFDSNRFDSGSGNLVAGLRQYTAEDAHFLQEDAFGNAGANLDLSLQDLDQNRYALAGGDPVNFNDADGHMVVPIDGGAGGGQPHHKGRCIQKSTRARLICIGRWSYQHHVPLYLLGGGRPVDRARYSRRFRWLGPTDCSGFTTVLYAWATNWRLDPNGRHFAGGGSDVYSLWQQQSSNGHDEALSRVKPGDLVTYGEEHVAMFWVKIAGTWYLLSHGGPKGTPPKKVSVWVENRVHSATPHYRRFLP